MASQAAKSPEQTHHLSQYMRPFLLPKATAKRRSSVAPVHGLNMISSLQIQDLGVLVFDAFSRRIRSNRLDSHCIDELNLRGLNYFSRRTIQLDENCGSIDSIAVLNKRTDSVW